MPVTTDNYPEPRFVNPRVRPIRQLQLRGEDTFSSLRSTKHQFALHSARVLSIDGSAQSATSSIRQCHGRTRECLTLTLRPWRASRRAAFTGLPTPQSAALSLHTRARRTPRTCERARCNRTRVDCFTFSGAHVCQAVGLWPLRGQMFGKVLRAHPRRADACCSSVPKKASGPSSRQVSALLGKRTRWPVRLGP